MKTRQPTHLLLRRIWAVALRHIYLHLGSWPRIVEMVYWPLANMAMFGFTSLYVTRSVAHIETVGSIMVAGVILNEMFLRPSITTLMLFMEELWSRNLGHLFASPIHTGEYIAGLLGTALVRSMLAVIPACILAPYLFHFSLATLGWPVVIFIPLLAISGAIYGLMIVSFLLRFGLAAEWLAWMATWLLLPFFAPYYPVSVLPRSFQYVSYLLPPTYIFESMKSLIGRGDWQPRNILIALGLMVLYGLLAALVFNRAYQNARRNGRLLQSGE